MTGITDRIPLGTDDLLVSPLALGTMTFGREPWGCDAATSASIMDSYLGAGGNLIDSADVYGGRTTETIIGQYLRTRKIRDDVLLASKYSLDGTAGDPQLVGNGAKSLHRALDGSLRRLQTDHIDLYFMHVWDGATQIDEVLTALEAARSAGKIRHAGLSNVPAWYASRAHAIASAADRAPIRALQLEYSIVERTIEYEFPGFCAETGTGLMVWSPLGNGFLTGKYQRPHTGNGSACSTPMRSIETRPPRGRLDHDNPAADPNRSRFTERNWLILDEVAVLAESVNATVPQVALRWVTDRPAVTVTVIGATRPEQVQASLNALTIDLPRDCWRAIDTLSRPPYAVPYDFMTTVQNGLRSGAWRL